MGIKNSIKSADIRIISNADNAKVKECPTVKALRDRVGAQWESCRLTQKDWVLGTYTGQDEEAKNYIAIELNRYIQITNWKGEELSLSNFKSCLRATEYLERSIAMKKHKVHIHERKWSPILRALN